MLLGFAGERFSGKDTAANYLAETYGFTHLKFAGKLKRAVEILFDLPDDWSWDLDKEVPRDIFQGYSPRQILQWYGTDGFPEDLCVQFDFYRHLSPIIQVLFDCDENTKLSDAVYPYDVSEVCTAIARGGFRHNVHEDFWNDILLPRTITTEFNWHKKHDIGISDVRFKNEVINLIWRHNGYLVYLNDARSVRVVTNHESESNQDWLRARSDYYIDNCGTVEDFYRKLEIMYEFTRNRDSGTRAKRFADTSEEMLDR